MKQRKRPHPYLSQARAFFRVAAKKRREGDYRSGDWYGLLAQKKMTEYYKATGQWSEVGTAVANALAR